MASTISYNSSNWNDTNGLTDNGASYSVSFSVFMLVVAVVISVLNLCCLVLLVKEKKLKQNRFDTLVICLSISDAATGILSSGFSIQSINFKITGNGVPPFCFIGATLITSTIIFSLIQTLWICIERLVATFPTAKVPCKKIPLIVIIVGLYITCVTFTFAVYVMYAHVWSVSCESRVIFGQNRIKTLSIFQPIYLLIVTAIIVTYVIVIVRVYRSWRRINPHSSDNSQNMRVPYVQESQTVTTIQEEPSAISVRHSSNRNHVSTRTRTVTKTGIGRILKMAVTLGLVILALLLSVLPKIILGLAVIGNPTNKTLWTAMEISDIFLFLNPLLDPIIYVLRIRSFRERLKCKCFSS